MVVPGDRADDDRTSYGSPSPRRARGSDPAAESSRSRLKPWQRPPQFQHGPRRDIPGDAESTGALLARLAAVRALAESPTPLTWRPGQAGLPVGGAGSPIAPDAASAYLRLLDRVLEDRVITRAEVRRLREFARQWGIGALETERLHRIYITRVWERLTADDDASEADLQDIRTLASLLRLPLRILRKRGRRTGPRWVAVPIEPGANVIGSPAGRRRARG